MWYCLSCKRLTPAGQYCSFCGRSRGRICQHGHVNPSYAERCATCGSSRLTTPTAWIGLGWVSRAIVLAGAIMLLRVVLSHACTLALVAARVLVWALSTATGATPVYLQQLTYAAITVAAVVLVISWMLPPALGGPLRAGLLGALRATLFLAETLVKLAGRSMHRRSDRRGASRKH